MKYPKECPVFERDDGVVYECVDVSRGHLTLLVRHQDWFDDALYAEYQKTPAQIEGVTTPATETARAMLAIARGAK